MEIQIYTVVHRGEGNSLTLPQSLNNVDYTMFAGKKMHISWNLKDLCNFLLENRTIVSKGQNSFAKAQGKALKEMKKKHGKQTAWSVQSEKRA